MANLEAFEEKISSAVHPAHSPKETARQMVIAALETEFGRAFTISPSFAKMVDALAEVLVTNPDLRRQVLSVASFYIKKNRDYQKSR
jgi:hypothetical protein